jgi:hypothetical protein
MNELQRWWKFLRADRLGRTPQQRREDAARRKRPVPGADAPPSAAAGGGAHRPGRAPAPGSPHAPSRKVVDIRTCGCVYVWDRDDREWNLVACGTDWAAYARQGRRDLTQWLKDGAP